MLKKIFTVLVLAVVVVPLATVGCLTVYAFHQEHLKKGCTESGGTPVYHANGDVSGCETQPTVH